MAIYTTVENIHKQIRYISSATDVSTSLIANFIEEAETVVNAKIGIRYSVPFGVNSVPPVIQTITTKLATASVITEIGMVSDDLAKGVLQRFDKYEEMLTEIGSGTMSIVTSDGTVIGQATSGIEIVSTTKDFKPVFDMRDPVDWRVDADLIDDENSRDL